MLLAEILRARTWASIPDINVAISIFKNCITNTVLNLYPSATSLVAFQLTLQITFLVHQVPLSLLKIEIFLIYGYDGFQQSF